CLQFEITFNHRHHHTRKEGGKGRQSVSIKWSTLLFAIIVGTDAAALYLCLMECICRSGFCYLHRSRSPDYSLSVVRLFVS
ncbi:MAG: hypothetical protein ACJ71J_12200, partial [Nitrososphaeraceae archaeon]